MPLRLILMRHAKSSWDDAAMADHERTLNERGRREASLVGARLAEFAWTPEIVLCSDARRTIETFEQMQPQFAGVRLDVRVDFYLGTVAPIRRALAELEGDVHTALCLGHNPGWEHAVTWLCGVPVEMKTATAALLTSDAADWEAAVETPHTWRLLDVIRPKEVE
jgi:phosphohistidine phosphatase